MRTSSGGDGAAAASPQRQAWEWLRLLTSRAASPEDVRAFRQWVDASPAHLAAYREVKTLWDAIAPSAGLVVQAEPGLRASYHRKRLRKRRAFLGSCVATAGVAGVAAVAVAHPPLGLWPAPGEWNAEYRTATGEQRSLALTPGVDVMLNTRTSARRAIEHGDVIGLELLAGEAAVDLQGGRGFTVSAGAGRSRAETGQFDVRNVDGRVCVTCIAGKVAVMHPHGSLLLDARQQVIYDDAAVGAVVPAEPDVVSAWRSGLLAFRQARLVDVVDEINRYRPGRVVLINAGLRDRQVTGHFRIGALDQAIDQLEYTLDLSARFLPGGLVLLG